MSQLDVPGLHYPDTKPGMIIDDFRRWTCPQLEEYLGDRNINRDGFKGKLVANAYGAYKFDLTKWHIKWKIIQNWAYIK